MNVVLLIAAVVIGINCEYDSDEVSFPFSAELLSVSRIDTFSLNTRYCARYCAISLYYFTSNINISIYYSQKKLSLLSRKETVLYTVLTLFVTMCFHLFRC